MWKDLNIGIDLEIFGISYHLTDCDKATRVYNQCYCLFTFILRIMHFLSFCTLMGEQEFMRSQGIVLNEVEARPALPETTPRPLTANPMLRITPRATCDVSKVRRSMEYGGKVLT